MSTESILGPMASRAKTDLRLPQDIVDRMKELAGAIGTPANAVYAIAAAQLVVSLSSVMEPSAKKREAIVTEMERSFQNIVSAVRKIR
jgi:hypothetical protein